MTGMMIGDTKAVGKDHKLKDKKNQRKEKKLKKMAALLEITRLNDKDRKLKAAKQHKREINVLDEGSSSGSETSDISYSKKRKTDGTLTDDTRQKHESRLECEQSKVSVENEKKGNQSDPPSHKLSNVGKEYLTGDDFKKLKAELRERKRMLKCTPKFRLKEAGERSSLTVKEEIRTPIFISDVQHLLLYSMLGHHSPYWPSRWCHLEKYNRLSHVLLLVIDGFSVHDFLENENSLTVMSTLYPVKVEVITSAAYKSSLVQDIVAVPLTGVQKCKLEAKFGSLESALTNGEVYKVMRAFFPVVVPENKKIENTPLHPNDSFPRTRLLLSVSQLLEEGYPLYMKGELGNRYSDYVYTKDVYKEVTALSPMFGLDCEMCQTIEGLELTRVSLVDEDLNVLYDSFVKPHNSIIDYLTRYSGVTKKILSDVTVRLPEVQQELRRLLPPDAILVGQSLNNDLHALKMLHPYVIDTSVIFNLTGNRMRRSKLQHLAEKFLDEEIQKSSKGHSSIEDSTACMKLTKLKLAKGIHFGDVITTSHLRAEAVSQLQRNCQDKGINDNNISDHTSAETQYATSLFNHVTRIEKNATIIGCDEVMQKYSSYISEASLNSSAGENKLKSSKTQLKCLVEKSNKDVIRRTCEVVLENSFTLSHIVVSNAEDQIEKTCKCLNRWCHRIYEHVAVNAMCVVLFSGHNGGPNGACFITLKKSPEISTWGSVNSVC